MPAQAGIHEFLCISPGRRTETHASTDPGKADKRGVQRRASSADDFITNTKHHHVNRKILAWFS
jgi:hypothetical protein